MDIKYLLFAVVSSGRASQMRGSFFCRRFICIEKPDFRFQSINDEKAFSGTNPREIPKTMLDERFAL
jgi:hypothetical protein